MKLTELSLTLREKRAAVAPSFATFASNDAECLRSTPCHCDGALGDESLSL